MKNAGQPNTDPRINVKDWYFVPSTRSDNNAGTSGTLPNDGYQAQGMPKSNYGGMPAGQSYDVSALFPNRWQTSLPFN